MPNIRNSKGLTALVEFILLTSSSMVGRPQTQIPRQYSKSVPIKKKKRIHDHILKQAARQQAIYQRISWRDYQKSLKQAKSSQKRLRQIFRAIFLVALVVGAIYGLWALWSFFQEDVPISDIESGTDIKQIQSQIDDAPESFNAPQVAPTNSRRIIIKPFIDEAKLLNLTEEKIELTRNGVQYQVETSLDPALQSTLIKHFDKVNSRYIGIVAMAPDSGRILAYTGFNKTGSDLNPCTTNKFPAASVFKIITAAAASDKFGFTCDTRLKFNGYKHTLYKTQLRDRENRFTNHISFRNSFAQSVNPVFGKIGSLRLGKTVLEEYGEAFGFNHTFNSEITIFPSHLSVSEDKYRLAEIASGFNRETTLSPVHAAMIVSTILNGGQLIDPTIVDRIVDESGKIIYSESTVSAKQVISTNTSNVIHSMMETTVNSGTARKAFRGYKRDKVLKRLTIGGKTGSIYNRPHDARFDWFVGFAQTKDLSEKMVISVVVAHEEYIGRRAGEYARLAFITHFKNYFAKEEAKRQQEQSS